MGELTEADVAYEAVAEYEADFDVLARRAQVLDSLLRSGNPYLSMGPLRDELIEVNDQMGHMLSLLQEVRALAKARQLELDTAA